MRTRLFLCCTFVIAWFFLKSATTLFAQKSLILKREQHGLQPIETVAKQQERPGVLTADDSEILSQILESGKTGKWNLVQSILSNYTGQATAVYSAAMTIAFRLKQYEAGANIFKQMRTKWLPMNALVFTTAIRIFSKLAQHDQIERIWAEASKTGAVDDVMFGAMIAAASEAGNVEAAMQFLESMEMQALSPRLVDYSAAINACKNSKPPDATAAMELLSRLQQQRLQPNMVTLTGIVGAHEAASIEQLQQLRAMIADQQIGSYDDVFVEVYLRSLGFAAPPGIRWSTGAEAATFLRSAGDRPRLREAASLLRAAREQGAGRTRLARCMDAALRSMALEDEAEEG